MSFLSALICGLFVSPAQFAPTDVPKNHWAYGAVNELFENGLLRGYPDDKPLKLQKVAWNEQQYLQAKKRFRAEGLGIGYPEGMGQFPATRYEHAVMVHAAWWTLTNMEAPIKPELLKEIPSIARQIGMVQIQLTKLGANPTEMIAKLEELRQRYEGRFQG